MGFSLWPGTESSLSRREKAINASRGFPVTAKPHCLADDSNPGRVPAFKYKHQNKLQQGWNKRAAAILDVRPLTALEDSLRARLFFGELRARSSFLIPLNYLVPKLHYQTLRQAAPLGGELARFRFDPRAYYHEAEHCGSACPSDRARDSGMF
jgi:hypothetical protein